MAGAQTIKNLKETGIEIDPEQYEDWYKTDKGVFADILEKEMISGLCKIGRGDRVLEIGCGTGHFSSYFEQLGAQVTGLDTSPGMLRTAKDRHGDKKIDFEAGDAYRLPFPDHSFDLVAMITTLEFISSPKKALEEAFRVSKSMVFIGFLNRNSLLAWQRKRSGKKIWREARFYTLDEISGHLGKCKTVKQKSVLFLPLINSKFLFTARLNIERLLSNFNMPFGAFTGIIVKSGAGD